MSQDGDDDGLGRRMPPHDREAERGLLGSMLRDNELVGDIVHLIKAEHFYSHAHQELFKAITTLSVERGVPADPVTLGHYLNENQLTEDVGGVRTIIELWDGAPSAANAVHYAEIIRQKAIVRNLIRTCTELQTEANEASRPAQELLDTAERRILEIAEMGLTGETKTLQEAVQEAYVRLDARQKHSVSEFSGVPTGFTALDQLLAGMQNSELIILAARPSVGKTAFALNMIRHIVVEENMPALFVSLEQARIELAERLLCCQGLIDSHKLRKGTLNVDDNGKLVTAGLALSNAKLFIDDAPGQNMLRIAANARRLKLRHGIRIVAIDYLQLIDPDNRKDSRQEQVSAISRRLKFLARELKIPVVALAQVNRGLEDRGDKKPRLSDLRESGAIEQDADTVMMLHRPDYHEAGEREGQIDVLVEKQRNGPTGAVTLIYEKKYMKFQNMAMQLPPTGGF